MTEKKRSKAESGDLGISPPFDKDDKPKPIFPPFDDEDKEKEKMKPKKSVTKISAPFDDEW